MLFLKKSATQVLGTDVQPVKHNKAVAIENNVLRILMYYVSILIFKEEMRWTAQPFPPHQIFPILQLFVQEIILVRNTL